MAAAVLFPRWQRWRYVRAVVRPVYLQLCQYLGTDPGDQPGPVADHPQRVPRRPGRGGHAGLPAHLEP